MRRSDTGATGGRASVRFSRAFSIEVRKEIRHLVHAHPMKLRVGDFSVEPPPDRHRDVLSRRHSGRELGHLEVQMAMVVHGDDFALQNVFELFEVDDEAGDGIRFTGDRDLQCVVMSVSLAVGAPAEDTLVLLLAPCGIEVEMGSGELSLACEQNHMSKKLAISIDA